MPTTIEAEQETKTIPGEQRFLLNGVSWETYRVLVEDPGLFHIHMTYEQGALELMSPSPRHEIFKGLLGNLVKFYAVEAGIDFKCLGSTTYSREMLRRGLEPDDSFYVQHELEVRGRDDLDFDHDPPPDLAIEIEITSSILDKLEVYAALQFPEVWRFDGKSLTALILNDDGKYVEQKTSDAFPDLPLSKLVEWIERRKTIGESALLAEFQRWVRESQTDDSVE